MALDTIKLENLPQDKEDWEKKNLVLPIVGKDSSTNRKQFFAKKFGPMNLNLKINPFGNSGAGFYLDLTESYKIFSESKNFTELSQGFKPDENYKILPFTLKEVYTQINEHTDKNSLQTNRLQ